MNATYIFPHFSLKLSENVRSVNRPARVTARGSVLLSPSVRGGQARRGGRPPPGVVPDVLPGAGGRASCISVAPVRLKGVWLQTIDRMSKNNDKNN